MARATALREAVKKRFYPFVEKRGFVRAKSKDPFFVTFRRVRGDTVDVFDVQWEKYWRPCFVLNFGQGPSRGVDVQGTHVSGTELEPYHCTPCGRLQRRRGGSLACWFQLRRPWRGFLTSGKWAFSPDEVVEELIGSFDELEAWWSGKIEGPHIYIWRSTA